jgi:hypothetical protein
MLSYEAKIKFIVNFKLKEQTICIVLLTSLHLS